jgi:mRNA-degrading endonuclease RelE of RelBE toxin-antitoxin system
VILEARYSRSFLLDLRQLDQASFERVYEFVFFKFLQFERIQELPELHQLGSHPIFYRFRLGDYLIAIQVIGHFVKFLRILPLPDTDEL